MYSFTKPFLFRFDAETVHHWTLKSLKLAERLGLLCFIPKSVDKPFELMDLTFKNRVGLAAGLDKNGEVIDAFARLGFGFIEVGTVTPKPQAGNPKPRLFRIPEAEAIINRMGFNNHGIDYLVAQVKQSKFKGILGINIGKNKDTPNDEAIEDYKVCLQKAYPVASYIVINISSPNTPGLRDLQHGESLDDLLSALKDEQQALAQYYKKYVPLVIKIAPDLTETNVDNLAKLLLEHQIDGVIATNTTINHKSVEHLPNGGETGGLSGQPVFEQSTQVVRWLAKRLPKTVPIIACGGINSPKQARAKLNAGASAVQIYSGLIYQGPRLIRSCVTALP